MESTHNIEHEGIVVSISDRKIVVKIMAQSACSGCHAKGACSAADLLDKLVDIVPDGQSYQTGAAINRWALKQYYMPMSFHLFW